MRFSAFLICLLALGLPSFATPNLKVIVGTVANSNLEQGVLIESSAALDVAVSGHGFIPLLSHSGEVYFTRYGAFGMNRLGKLEHVPSGYLVGAPDAVGNLKPIDLVAFAVRPYFGRKGEFAKLTAMGFNQDGLLEGFYSDGQTVTIAKLHLAAFENQRKLVVADEKKYLLQATQGVGQIAYLLPQQHPVGKLMGRHLESIDMQAYLKALR